MTEWMSLVKKEMAKGMSLGEAMKEAKKHYHKNTHKGGMLVKTGGRRRRTTRKQRGGQLYGFGEKGGTLADGNGRMTPVASVADASNKVYAGGRRRHSRKH
jgi:hypothetical protein